MSDPTTHNANSLPSTASGHNFVGISISGYGNRVHLGDSHTTTGKGGIDPQEDAALLLKDLKPHVNKNASYNSSEREQEGASICQSGTRERILRKIQGWIDGEGPPVLWLHGPAGTGKSTIAQTIAEQCDDRRNLAFSYFFSRRNANRNDLTKFMPTFASELVRALPSLSTPVRKAISRDPYIFGRRLELQAKALIVEPLKATFEQMPRMVVVIDGLDEYSDETGKLPLENLVHVLVEAFKDMHFRIFFASRPESYINAIFNRPHRNIEIMEIPLRDWETTRDVLNYLRTELSQVQQDKQIQAFPWPSENDLWALVKKSEGIFIYASTLVKFVGARNCNSIKRLHEAMVSHKGLDSLFAQVLGSAKDHPDFQLVLGIIMFLHNPLKLEELAQFLKWSIYDIRSALEGSLSILYVPEEDDNFIRPYHASLQDFLNDSDRSGNHFLDPATNHRIIFQTSARVIEEDTDFFTTPNQGVYYAYRHWCHHLCSVINDSITNDDSKMAITLMKRLSQDCTTRMARLKSHEDVENWLVEFEEIVVWAKQGQSGCEALIDMGQQLQEKIHAFMRIYKANFVGQYFYGSLLSGLQQQGPGGDDPPPVISCLLIHDHFLISSLPSLPSSQVNIFMILDIIEDQDGDHHHFHFHGDHILGQMSVNGYRIKYIDCRQILHCNRRNQRDF